MELLVLKTAEKSITYHKFQMHWNLKNMRRESEIIVTLMKFPDTHLFLKFFQAQFFSKFPNSSGVH